MSRPIIPVFGLDVRALADTLAPILAAALVKALPQVASQVAREQGQALSGGVAAKMARCRRHSVTMAMQSGAQPARKLGRRWLTTAGEVAEWIRSGRPEELRR